MVDVNPHEDESNMNNTAYELIPGKVIKHISLDDYIIRKVENKGDDGIEISWMAQGHLTNVSDKPVDDVKIDISYYDSNDSFLGLDKSGFFDEDELEPKSTMAFSVDLDIPDGTKKCIINISCKKMPTGIFMNWFYRGNG